MKIVRATKGEMITDTLARAFNEFSNKDGFSDESVLMTHNNINILFFKDIPK